MTVNHLLPFSMSELTESRIYPLIKWDLTRLQKEIRLKGVNVCSW